jgi:hypothetical protein
MITRLQIKHLTYKTNQKCFPATLCFMILTKQIFRSTCIQVGMKCFLQALACLWKTRGWYTGAFHDRLDFADRF